MPLLHSVLLVDDDSTAAFLHQLLLQKMSVAEQVLVAEDGQRALDLLAALGPLPQLILLDLNMPVMNGPEFLVQYARLPAGTPRPVVIVLSSSGQALSQSRLAALPVDGFLEKPLTRPKLAAVLARHFSEAAQA